MNYIGNVILAEVYGNIDVFLIIFTRILGFIVIMPVISASNIPNTVKVLFTIVTSLIIFSTGVVTTVEYNDNILSLGYLFVKEFTVGLMIGFVGQVFFSLITLMGQLVDFQLGLSMVSVYDPISQIQAPITANLFYYTIVMLLLQSGGLHAFIAVIAKSYDYIPAGDASLILDGKIIHFIIYIIETSFKAGIKFALPIIITITVIDVGLGILVKSVPQINVFVVGIPLKLLLGYFVMFTTMPIVFDIYDFILNESIKNMMDLIQGLILHGG